MGILVSKTSELCHYDNLLAGCIVYTMCLRVLRANTTVLVPLIVPLSQPLFPLPPKRCHDAQGGASRATHSTDR